MDEKDKMMRSLLFTAFFLAMTLPACAGNAGSAETVATSATIAISGYQIPTPRRIDQPVEWETVKGYVPDSLYKTPTTPKKVWEIYNDVNRLTQEKMNEYEEALSELAKARQDEFPGKSLEDVEFILADLFVTGDGNDISPDVQKLAYEYAALQYLHEAFQAEAEAQGYNPLYYAPGPMPGTLPEPKNKKGNQAKDGP